MAVSPLVSVYRFQKSILPAVSGRANNGDANFTTLMKPRQQYREAVVKNAFNTQKTPDVRRSKNAFDWKCKMSSMIQKEKNEV